MLVTKTSAINRVMTVSVYIFFDYTRFFPEVNIINYSTIKCSGAPVDKGNILHSTEELFIVKRVWMEVFSGICNTIDRFTVLHGNFIHI